MTAAGVAGPPASDAPDGPEGTDASGHSDPEAVEPGHALGLSEALVLAGGLIVALLAWASLALANLGAHSLLAVVLVTGLALAGVAAVVLLVPGRPPVRLDRAGLAVLAGVGLLAAVMSFPGFPYAIGDKDPGLYVLHGEAIAREGSTSFDDPVLAQDLPQRFATPGARFPGVWVDPDDPDRINPQFFHLYPALLATADDVAGTTGAFNVNPALAVLSAIAVALAVRRAFGTVAGALAGVLLATSMLQVWQAKYPTTEVLAQALFAVGLLAGAVTIETRWRPAAGLAGLVLPLVFLARPDGLLLVLIAIVGSAAVYAVRGWDARLGWFGLGLALPLPHAAAQAWIWNEPYASVNDLPSFTSTLLVAAGAAAAAVLWRRVLHRRAVHLLDRIAPHLPGARGVPDPRERARLLAGLVLIVGSAAFLIFLAYRPSLLGEDGLQYNRTVIRSFDEMNLERLSWFVTVPGLVTMWAGVVVLGLRRWRAVQWAVVLPAVALLPVYLWAARISPRLMWWGRRYVPTVLVGIVILVAVALAFAWVYRGRWWPAVRTVAVLSALFLVGSHLRQSLPLRDHRELAGSYGVVEQISDQAGGEQGVFLWPRSSALPDQANSLGSSLWLRYGHVSAGLPDEVGPHALDRYAEAFPDARRFVVTSNQDPPPPALADRLEEVDHIAVQLPFWEESLEHRPGAAGAPFPIEVTVYEDTGESDSTPDG